MSADTPRRLGRGLEALISTAKLQRESTHPETAQETGPPSDLRQIRIVDIAPNRFQPRRTFTEAELIELEASIKANGLLQPIVVRSQPGGGWELVAGERRLRATTRLGWAEIPAVVRDFDDRAMLTLALVENLQRADLNALEEAEGYQRLIDEFGLTQQQVADAVGKDRTTITNLLRILTLQAAIRTMVEQGLMTTGHARALLPVRDQKQQLQLANEILARQLSVRQAEARARDMNGNSASGKGGPASEIAQPIIPSEKATDPVARRIEEQLRRQFQTDVHVQQLGKGRGTIRISYYSADDIERILDLVLGKTRSDFD